MLICEQVDNSILSLPKDRDHLFVDTGTVLIFMFIPALWPILLFYHKLRKFFLHVDTSCSSVWATIMIQVQIKLTLGPGHMINEAWQVINCSHMICHAEPAEHSLVWFKKLVVSVGDLITDSDWTETEGHTR